MNITLNPIGVAEPKTAGYHCPSPENLACISTALASFCPSPPWADAASSAAAPRPASDQHWRNRSTAYLWTRRAYRAAADIVNPSHHALASPRFYRRGWRASSWPRRACNMDLAVPVITRLESQPMSRKPREGTHTRDGLEPPMTSTPFSFVLLPIWRGEESQHPAPSEVSIPPQALDLALPQPVQALQLVAAKVPHRSALLYCSLLTTKNAETGGGVQVVRYGKRVAPLGPTAHNAMIIFTLTE